MDQNGQDEQSNAVSSPVQQVSADVPVTPLPTQPVSGQVVQPEPKSYVENVGVSVVDLLTDISLSDALQQKVAGAMRMPVAEFTTILEGLLNKIDGEFITETELALIMTAPVADGGSEQKQTS